MRLCTVFAGLFVAVYAQINPNEYPYSFNPFSAGFNPLPPGMFQSGVFSPDWGANLARRITETTRNAISNSNGSGAFTGISTIDGISTVSVHIGGRRYSAQLPSNSAVSVSSNYGNYNGQQVEEVRIVVNGDVSVYRTVDGRTIVTDGYGNIRRDGGPLRIY
ncbi:hypothetical protein KIN20_001615 [Parelaphostrongylus tenuis]|uniref:Uncharacterized protein n=1 Tax=Parelaphostrongylus tenuis TaxID=148309 RepID=A0AAD5QCF2_PARTN|nr:hypothetical protein KIN20_001615 [Parelaphostrongylus tenuis]